MTNLYMISTKKKTSKCKKKFLFIIIIIIIYLFTRINYVYNIKGMVVFYYLVYRRQFFVTNVGE